MITWILELVGDIVNAILFFIDTYQALTFGFFIQVSYKVWGKALQEAPFRPTGSIMYFPGDSLLDGRQWSIFLKGAEIQNGWSMTHFVFHF